MLIPLQTSVHCIPERVKEYDPQLFIVFNTLSQRYEIHHHDLGYNATIPYPELDARTIEYLRENDIRVHGDDIFRRIEKMEAQAEKSKEREWKNWVESVAKDTRSLFAKDAWTEV